MSKIKPIDWTSIELHLQELPKAFITRQAELLALTVQLTELQETHCTGTEHWRDTNSDSKTPKLYVIHPTNVDCPIHGSPEPGKRIRSYIGSKRTNIIAAQNAIAKGKRYQTTLTELRAKHQNIKRAAHTLKRIYWELGADPPTPPLENLPEPLPVQ